MGYTNKLQLDIRFKKDLPPEVLDFLLNGHIYEHQFDFKYFYGEDAYEEHNIFTVKNQYQYTKNGVDEYRYELFARIFVKDDDFAVIFKFCAYMAQFTENNGFVGYYINEDKNAAEPDLIYFNGEKVSVKDFNSGAVYTYDWADDNNPKL